MFMLPKKQSGFTIIELLIVIVIIAILAAITLVAYSGVQQRANNVAIISAAKQTIKLIDLWNVSNSPLNANVCATADNSCTSWNGTVQTSDNSSLLNGFKTVGTPVASVPHMSSSRYGIYYNYRSGMTFNDQPARGLLMYWLQGTQDCGMENIAMQVAATGSEPDPWVTSTTGNTGSSAGLTTCYVAINF